MSAISPKKRKAPHTAYKKGQSGNPLGRPPGPGLTKMLIDAMKDKSPSGKTYAEMLVLRVVQKAIGDGDPRLIEFIWDRVEGKLPQAVEHSGSIGLDKLVMESMGAENPGGSK